MDRLLGSVLHLKLLFCNSIGHPKAKRAYAWTYRKGDQNKTIAVLEIPPVDSPESAVKVAIASKARKL